jgi:hypothetical protein
MNRTDNATAIPNWAATIKIVHQRGRTQAHSQACKPNERSQAAIIADFGKKAHVSVMGGSSVPIAA